MSFSSIELCSKALNKIGANSITSLDEGTVEADICSSIYSSLKQKLLSLYSWSFAIKTSNLEKTELAERYDYTYAYVLPIDFLRAIKIASGDSYKIAGNYLFSDDNEVNLEYVADVEESKFSPLFISAFI